MTIEEVLAPVVKQVAESLYGVPFEESTIQLQKTKKEFEGDITLVVFPFSKAAKKSPVDTAQELGKELCERIDWLSGFNAVQGFLNLSVSDNFWSQKLIEIYRQAEEFGKVQDKSNQVMVEFSSPNTNKPLHLGHLRNIFLGHSVSEILRASGNDVVRTQIINDRGIHICKSMLAWQRFGNGETPESSGMKGDKLVGKYYVEFDKALRVESNQLLVSWDSGNFGSSPADIQAEYRRLKQAHAEKQEDEKSRKGIEGKMRELANSQTAIMTEVKEMLLKWEANDPEVYALWSKMNGWVYEGFGQTYKLMGVDFDKLYYESDTYVYGKDMVEEGLRQGVFLPET